MMQGQMTNNQQNYNYQNAGYNNQNMNHQNAPPNQTMGQNDAYNNQNEYQINDPQEQVQYWSSKLSAGRSPSVCVYIYMNIFVLHAWYNFKPDYQMLGYTMLLLLSRCVRLFLSKIGTTFVFK